MPVSSLKWCLLFLLTVTVARSSADAAEPSPEQVEFFEQKIRPVLVTHCLECHGGEETAQGNLRLDSRDGMRTGGDSGPVLVPGKARDSLLIKALRYQDLEMPPKGRLPDSVIADFEAWIGMGAPDPRTDVIAKKPAEIDYQTGLQFWAFQKPVLHQPPAVRDADWPLSDIDRFILSKLEAANLPPAPRADRRTLIRRAYFDLTGLPPSPEQVDAFVKNPAPDQDAFAAVVDELLQSPHYGERWARYWLDIARYGEDQAHTFKARLYPRGYLYRDWVINAFNRDLPYDRFLIEQIAGDLLSDDARHERIAALGLFALGPVYYQDNGEKDKALADEWDDRIDTLIRGTQALTISCARCHDHKYDPVSMTDYYGLMGIFASTQYEERPAVPTEVVAARKAADADVNEQQLSVERYLGTQARSVRSRLLDEIPAYVSAAWQVMVRRMPGRDDKKHVADVAKQKKLSEDLLRRWVDYLDEKPGSGATTSERVWLADWRTLKAELKPGAKDGSEKPDGEDVPASVTAFASALQTKAREVAALRKPLLDRFGEDAAFLKDEDRAVVAAGQIPLGNLFDDAKGTRLTTALASDPFRSTATAQSLGVALVRQGWGTSTSIASGIDFNFESLGSDDRAHGAVTNDGWDTTGGIRTLGRGASGKLERTEQGVGMHANALVTFDLNEIRQAGLIPADRVLSLRIDRAGLNDDVFGSSAPSVHMAVIVSRPHRNDSEFDAILGAWVNGEPVKVSENDQSYSIAGPIPAPIKADGRFFTLDVPLPLDARYVTLVVTGAAMEGEDNPINSDHAVFSGVCLEYEPQSEDSAERLAQSTADPGANDAFDKRSESEQRALAVYCSELFSDRGLLAIPAKEAGKYLSGDAAGQLAAMQDDLKKKQAAAEAIQVLMAHAVSEGKSVDMPVYLAGDPRKKGPQAPRSFLAVMTGGERQPFEATGSGRMDLARAIASKDNPLTARVWVNRIWLGHFGQGLVRTPSNFGQLGERPTHLELLDWLAIRFMQSGWSMKSLHRDIMLSATYQQSSSGASAANAVDPENRLLSRMNRRRLEVEPWRDALLAVTGRLDPSPGGPSRELGDINNRRRTLYGFVSRHRLDDLLRLFDFPDPNITAGQRTVTTVPLQQLFVLNSEFMTAQAKALAQRLTREGPDDAARIRRAYELLFSREPREDELNVGLEFLSGPLAAGSDLSALEQYSLALLGSNEFAFVD